MEGRQLLWVEGLRNGKHARKSKSNNYHMPEMWRDRNDCFLHSHMEAVIFQGESLQFISKIVPNPKNNWWVRLVRTRLNPVGAKHESLNWHQNAVQFKHSLLKRHSNERKNEKKKTSSRDWNWAIRQRTPAFIEISKQVVSLQIQSSTNDTWYTLCCHTCRSSLKGFAWLLLLCSAYLLQSASLITEGYVGRPWRSPGCEWSSGRQPGRWEGCTTLLSVQAEGKSSTYLQGRCGRRHRGSTTEQPRWKLRTLISSNL